MLFKDLNEVTAVLPVSSSADFNRLKPSIEAVERDFLITAISKAMFKKLEDYAKTGNPNLPADDKQKWDELLRLSRIAVIHLAYYRGYDYLNALISGTGFQRQESTTVKGLYKYQEDNLRNYFKSTGFNGIDDVLEYLEENITVFTDFRDSEEYKSLKDNFIPDTKTFDGIYFIGGSRLTFLRLKKHINTISELALKQVLGVDNLKLIREELAKDEPAQKVKDILPVIRKALAFLSAAMLMEDSGADLTEKGLYFESKISGYNNDTKVQPSEKDRIAALIKRDSGIGESYLLELKNHLKDHAADWNDYVATTGYIHNRDNTGKKIFVA